MRKLFQKPILSLVLSCFCAAALGQADLPNDYLSPAFHKGRREAARALMPDSSVLVVFAAPTRNFSNDVDYFYHQNPDLYYFTGYKEPHAVLLLFKETQTAANGAQYNEVFFVQKRDARAEQWTGRRLGTEGVKQKLGIETVYNGEDFKTFELDLSRFKMLYQLPEGAVDEPGVTGDLHDLLSWFNQKAKTEAVDKKESFKTFRSITGTLREIKTPDELVLIRKAVDISCAGQTEVMKAVHPDMSELEIQGLHEYVHKKHGAEGVGYGSIVGAGENGCVLHYMENTKTKIGRNMLLMDVGAEYHGYTADVTRTIPADGKFSAEEKAIYQLVYDAQEAAFKILKDGATWSDAGKAALDVIAAGLLKLGIIKKREEVGKYYPHGLSHHIGLDVHDRGVSRTLKKGMVITIEPGIYIPSDSDCDKKWWGIAVRIEDDALIRENDYELLSASAPRSVEAVEKMIAEKSVLDNFKLPALKGAPAKPL